MQKLSDNLIIEQLKGEENSTFQLLYKYFFHVIASYIRQNGGNNEDAEDIFQEAVVVLLQKVRQSDFRLTSSLQTFLYSIAKNFWLKRLRDKKQIKIQEIELSQSITEPLPFEIVPENKREEKVLLWLKRITENCQRILKAIFFYQEPMEILMKRMGWKNKHTASNLQYKCIQQIKKERLKDERV